ncbi:MAG: hypothetical protein C0475_04580 [Planctomyces sp.]|nr:hypothetical protein [Planctomyces sp.]MBA4120628.1 hypothetical protein [Isosphaera sp.]
MLGPLCVGMSGFVVGDAPVVPPVAEDACDAHLSEPRRTGDAEPPAFAEPPLWSLLGRAVSQGPGDDRGRVAIADSKALVRGGARHGRARAELLAAGVCAFMDARHMHTQEDSDAGAGPESPAAQAMTDLGVLDRLGVRLRPHAPAWARGVAATLPEPWGGPAAVVRARAVSAAMRRASVRCAGVWARAMFEAEFNRLTAQAGSKAAASGAVVRDLMRQAWALTRALGLPGLIVCDRQGGRRGYGPMLAAWLGPVGAAGVDTVAEGPQESEYVVRSGDAERSGGWDGVRVRFRVRAEGCSLPVALASMAAKLARELLMARFNAHYAGRARQRGRPEPEPTAGYTADARRWLSQAGCILDPGEAAELVRIC